MEIFLVRALQLIMALSLLVLIHEFGHFLFARIFKVRVEKFYLFFDWKFSLFKWKPKNSDTEYGVGWVPLGGYCKIAGMIDESMDTEQMKKPAQSWEYRSKPAWQRLFIIIGGVMFNLILAILIYSMVLFTWGDYYVDMRTMEDGFEFNETAKNIGFQDGDKILAFDGIEEHKLYLDKVRGTDIFRSICNAKEVTVQREGKEVKVTIPDTLGLLNMNKNGLFIGIRNKTVADSLEAGGIAQMAGMEHGDSIIAIDGTPITSWSNIKDILQTIKENKKETFTIEVVRDSTITLVATTNIDSLGDTPLQLGIYSTNNRYPLIHNEYGFFESFPAGIDFGMNVLRGYVSDFQYVFSAEGAQSVGMFASIGSLFPAEWDWHEFWLMTAFLSIILAFMNILPIPALDGGHALFLIAEMITGKQPSDKFMERAQMIGMIIILGLFILAMYNDLMKFVF